MRDGERFAITRAPRTDRPILALLGIGLVLTQTLGWLYVKRELPLGPTVFWTLFVVWVDVQLFRWGRWLKSYDRLELEVDETGITVVDAKQTKVFPWRELQAVAFAIDVPFSGTLRHPPGGPADPTPADELAVLAEVIRHHSGGRFPLPNRKIMPKHSPQN